MSGRLALLADCLMSHLCGFCSFFFSLRFLNGSKFTISVAIIRCPFVMISCTASDLNQKSKSSVGKIISMAYANHTKNTISLWLAKSTNARKYSNTRTHNDRYARPFIEMAHERRWYQWHQTCGIHSNEIIHPLSRLHHHPLLLYSLFTD